MSTSALISYSLLELIGITDALISPIRLGIVKPSASIVSNEDVLEVLQQHLTNKQDLFINSYLNAKW
ncbi:unnamed protein product [Meloidogyne enterolobii]|uniref:Uncharacterized protein n=1 Tax=Meloidogyne enterolobii TaxID=390850 RepID=A0ACB0YG61_MELEN